MGRMLVSQDLQDRQDLFFLARKNAKTEKPDPADPVELAHPADPPRHR
jgi:hypothetical protein